MSWSIEATVRICLQYIQKEYELMHNSTYQSIWNNKHGKNIED